MRTAAFAAVALSVALLTAGHARADQPSPFPSPSPTATAAPGSNGYAALGVDGLAISGGTAPASPASTSPASFPASGATGFSLDVAGRLSARALAQLRFGEATAHAADRPIITRTEGALLYGAPQGHAGFGLSYLAVQRSTAGAASTGIGVGAALLPEPDRRASPYGSAFFYPGLRSPGGSSSAATYALGVALAPPGAGGFFVQLGVNGLSVPGQSFGPASLFGFHLGIGTSF